MLLSEHWGITQQAADEVLLHTIALCMLLKHLHVKLLVACVEANLKEEQLTDTELLGAVKRRQH